MTQPQQRVLSALVALCPDDGCDVRRARGGGARRACASARSSSSCARLEKRRLVLVHEGEPEGWAPTMTGPRRASGTSGPPSRRRAAAAAAAR